MTIKVQCHIMYATCFITNILFFSPYILGVFLVASMAMPSYVLYVLSLCFSLMMSIVHVFPMVIIHIMIHSPIVTERVYESASTDVSGEEEDIKRKEDSDREDPPADTVIKEEKPKQSFKAGTKQSSLMSFFK